MKNSRDTLLSVEEAGELLGTGPELPRLLVAHGALDHVTDPTGEVRIPESSVIGYAAALPQAPAANSLREAS